MSKDIRKWSDGRYTLMFDEHTFFVWDNENDERMTALQVTKKLNEQQDTIKKLQDLCGESDGENAKLRIENKSLKDDLHNCRLNKNIISEKLKLWQDVHKEYNIYNIKDFEELMKKVKQKR